MNQLITKWGLKILEADNRTVVPRPEYPRPGMRRDQYVILNGLWNYEVKKLNYDKDGNMSGPIAVGTVLVPFSPETYLSGSGLSVLEPDEAFIYKRDFIIDTIPGESRLLLHFQAVDESCCVYVNDKKAGEHHGGYLPFEFDITDLILKGTNKLRVEVTDPSDTSYHARGKQTLKRGGMFYQAQSGIWDTVWCEWVPETNILQVKIDTDALEKTVTVKVMANKIADGKLYILEDGKVIRETQFASGVKSTIYLENPHLWSPEDPYLYDLKVVLEKDVVYSYFGMRTISLKKDAKGIRRVFLNGKPYFLHGLLDQGYWPESLMTPPSDEAMIFDIAEMKRLGFNMLRKHIKVESDRWYYHCDRLGMIVVQDAVNGGTEYDMNYICQRPNILPMTQRTTKDSDYKRFARADEEGRKEYYRDLEGMIRHLYNHPCIAVWVPFNEGWGQFDAKKAVAYVRKRDRSRLIDEASGWFDQRGGDFYSIHNYFLPLRVSPRKRIVALTEYGGYTYHETGHTAYESKYGYHHFKTKDKFNLAVKKLMQTELLPAIKKGLSMTVYTQVSDVEEEINGIYTWDRDVLKVSEDILTDTSRELFAEFKRTAEG